MTTHIRRRISGKAIIRVIEQGQKAGLTGPNVVYGLDGTVTVNWASAGSPPARKNSWDT